MSLIASLLVAGAISSSQSRLLDVSYAYTGMPLFMPSEEFRVASEPVIMVSQDTAIALRSSDYTLNSKTVYKNTTAGTVNGEIIIPLIYSGSFNSPVSIDASLNGRRITHTEDSSAIRGGTRVLRRYRVAFPAGAE